MVKIYHHETILGLTGKKALFYLNNLCNTLFSECHVTLLSDVPIGTCKTSLNNDSIPFVEVGIYGIVLNPINGVSLKNPNNRLSGVLPVRDLDFTQVLVSLYHEKTHVDQDFDINVDVPIALSEIATYKNLMLTKATWRERPHEIDAEFSGVMGAWDFLSDMCHAQKDADACMLDYINFRCRNSDYMLSARENGYESKDQVVRAFEDAYNSSLNDPRIVVGGLNGLKDEFNMLLESDKGIQSLFYPWFRQILDAKTGAEQDELMSRLVLHIHPELQQQYSCLADKNLSILPAMVDVTKYPWFRRDGAVVRQEDGHAYQKIPFPETSQESRDRLGITGEANMVKKISHSGVDIPDEFEELYEKSVDGDESLSDVFDFRGGG